MVAVVNNAMWLRFRIIFGLSPLTFNEFWRGALGTPMRMTDKPQFHEVDLRGISTQVLCYLSYSERRVCL